MRRLRFEDWRIPLIYAAVAGLWILFSDYLLDLAFPPSSHFLMSTLKGWFFILVTGVMLYYLIRRRNRRLDAYEYRIRLDAAAIRTLNRLYNFRSRLNAAIVRSPARTDLLQAFCDIAVAHGGLSAARVCRRGTGGVPRLLARAQAPGSILPEAASPESPEARLFAQPGDGEDAPDAQGNVAAALVRDAKLGVLSLTLFADEPEFFGRKEREFVRALADDVAFALAAIATRTERDSFFDLSADMLCIAGFDGYFKLVNAAWERTLGWTQGELLGMPWIDLVHEEDRADSLARLQELERGGSFTDFENRYRTREGGYRWLSWSCRPAPSEGLIYAVAHDITYRREAMDRLERSLEEKETLLREIHHRVKNNMQVMTSLLAMQATHCRDPHDAALMLESRDRALTMALVHEQLYRAQDLARVDFLNFTRNLVKHILEAYSGRDGQVSPVFELEELLVGIDKAVPLGIALNEMVSNAVKHGFANVRPGTLLVQLAALEPGRARLVVQDDGAGMGEAAADPGEEERGNGGMGLTLIRTLARQLDGTVAWEPGPAGRGTRCEMFFSLDKP